jgi:hypothetical protein
MQAVINDIVFSNRPVEFKQTILADVLNAYLVENDVRKAARPLTITLMILSTVILVNCFPICTYTRL